MTACDLHDRLAILRDVLASWGLLAVLVWAGLAWKGRSR